MSRDADNALAMQNSICRLLRDEFAMPERHASELAAAAMRALSDHCGGERVYIPKVSSEGPTGEQLRSEYDGSKSSRDSLCRKYGLSESGFYRRLQGGKNG